MYRNFEVIFDKDIQSFAREQWDLMDDELNALLGQKLSWDYGTGCSACGFLKVESPVEKLNLNNLKVGAKICGFKVTQIKESE